MYATFFLNCIFNFSLAMYSAFCVFQIIEICRYKIVKEFSLKYKLYVTVSYFVTMFKLSTVLLLLWLLTFILFSPIIG